MRTTLDIADDVLAAAKAIGKEQGHTSAAALRNVLLEEARRTPARRAPKGKLALWLVLETSRPIGARTFDSVAE